MQWGWDTLIKHKTPTLVYSYLFVSYLAFGAGIRTQLVIWVSNRASRSYFLATWRPCTSTDVLRVPLHLPINAACSNLLSNTSSRFIQAS